MGMRQQLSVCLFLAAVVTVDAADAQNRGSFHEAESSSVRYDETPYGALRECGDFVSRTNDALSVVTADVQTADSATPAHCRVTAIMPPEILFEVNLPLDWNGRFYMYGNGGFAGRPPSSKADVRDRALRRGFATAYTNTGHDARREPGASFAYNDPRKTLDYLYRAVHLTVVHAKELIAAFYGREADYSYWDGCSMGGRQGMVSAQRFPADFDGIVAGAPAFDFTGTMRKYVWQGRVMRRLHLSPAKLDLLAETVYDRCDATDGLEDGIIGDPRQCDFSPRRHLPRCAGADPGACFTDEEISGLRRLYEGPTRDGRSLHPGIMPGAEAVEVTRGRDGAKRRIRGWEPWLLDGDGPGVQTAMAQSYLRYLAFEVDDPDYDWTRFPIATEPEGLDRTTLRLLDAKETDLSRFKARGGRMLGYFGWADAAINPLPMIGYYEAVAADMDSSPHDFYLLYMIPGMFHCGGGVGAHEIDFMTPLIEWVESGERPLAIVGRRLEEEGPPFSRPHCPYPGTAQYKGRGSIAKDRNFECVPP